jgi:S1-C subfamily serine protease
MTSNNSKLIFLNWLLIAACLILGTCCIAFLIDRRPSVDKPQSATIQQNTNSSFGPRPSALPSASASVVAPSPVTAEPRRITVEELSTTDLFKATSPSVVHITTEAVRRDFFELDLTKIPKGSGTGFVWDKQGHVVTNYHVIRDADFAHVALADHSSWPAKLVGVASDKDLAVLKIDAPMDRLIPVKVGQSKNLEVGLKVYAIGNPFGLDQTLTTGIISALGREIESVTERKIRDVIQTDAAINPGNSGGPLLDSLGHLIGVNTAIYSPSGSYAGIGFAIPVDTVRRVVPQLIEHGKLIRPGLKIELAPEALAERLRLKGVLVMNVEPDSTAEAAGLNPMRRSRAGEITLGDAITAVNGKPIRSADDLWLLLEDFKVGDVVNLSIVREGEPAELKVTLEAIE